MKKILASILILVAAIMFIACKRDESNEKNNTIYSQSNVKLNNVVYREAETYYNERINKDVLGYINNFSNKLMKEIVSNENMIFSPISLYFALSMLNDGCINDARTELNNLLGEDIDLIRENLNHIYNNNYYNRDNNIAQLGNSIWFKKGYSIKTDYLEKLNSYYTEAFASTFSNKELDEIADWVNEKTNDLLNANKDNLGLSNDTILALINTIYFKNSWKVAFEEKDNKVNTFYGKTKNTSVTFMYHENIGSYHDFGKYVVGYDYLTEGARIKYILPDNGVDITELIKDKDVISEVLNYSTEFSDRCELHLTLPKFECFNDYELINPLKRLGVNNIFIPGRNIDILNEQKDLFVSRIKQSTGIKFTETGVEAASYTVIIPTLDCEDGCSGPQVKVLNLNRPFIYIITDNYNVPLFIGVVYNLGE